MRHVLGSASASAGMLTAGVGIVVALAAVCYSLPLLAQSDCAGPGALETEARDEVVGTCTCPSQGSMLLPAKSGDATHEPNPDCSLESELYADVVAVGNELGWHCSGVLLKADVVLTARHCLPATKVLFGASILAPDEVIEVGSSAAATQGEDVALLFLKAPSKVATRGMRSSADVDVPSGEVLSVGFGRTPLRHDTEYGKKSWALLLFGFSWGCDGNRPHDTGCIARFELVLPAEAHVDTCDGDSGGPLFEFHEGSLRLIGITSRSVGAASSRCGVGGIYTRVDRIADWIESTTAQ